MSFFSMLLGTLLLFTPLHNEKPVTKTNGSMTYVNYSTEDYDSKYHFGDSNGDRMPDTLSETRTYFDRTEILYTQDNDFDGNFDLFTFEIRRSSNSRTNLINDHETYKFKPTKTDFYKNLHRESYFLNPYTKEIERAEINGKNVELSSIIEQYKKLSEMLEELKKRKDELIEMGSK